MSSSTVLVVCVVVGAGDWSTLWHSPQSRAVIQHALTGDDGTFLFGSSPESLAVCEAVIGGGSFAEAVQARHRHSHTSDVVCSEMAKGRFSGSDYSFLPASMRKVFEGASHGTWPPATLSNIRLSTRMMGCVSCSVRLVPLSPYTPRHRLPIIFI
jgi:hypothetical protein